MIEMMMMWTMAAACGHGTQHANASASPIISAVPKRGTRQQVVCCANAVSWTNAVSSRPVAGWGRGGAGAAWNGAVRCRDGAHPRAAPRRSAGPCLRRPPPWITAFVDHGVGRGRWCTSEEAARCSGRADTLMPEVVPPSGSRATHDRPREVAVSAAWPSWLRILGRHAASLLRSGQARSVIRSLPACLVW